MTRLSNARLTQSLEATTERRYREIIGSATDARRIADRKKTRAVYERSMARRQREAQERHPLPPPAQQQTFVDEEATEAILSESTPPVPRVVRFRCELERALRPDSPTTALFLVLQLGVRWGFLPTAAELLAGAKR